MSLLVNKNLIKFTIFWNLIIIVRYKVQHNLNPFYLSNKKPILSYNNKKKEILIKGRQYLDKCLNHSNKQRYKYIKQPKISVIVPMFNCQKTIIAALNSIQYQNISKIEIILVNDFSTDNTSKIVKKINKKDQRIKIINNNKNMGTLYSRSIAALMAKGKYIFGLDNDDLFFDGDLFDYIYKKARKENLDLIGFLTVDGWDYTTKITQMRDIYTYQYPDNFYLEQPELSTWIIKFEERYIIHNNMIWDKCIKSSIYKDSVNLLGIKRYSKFLSWTEDTSMNFVIFNLARNFKYTHKYGIFHYRGKTTASLRLSVDSKIFGEIFFLDIIFDFSKDDAENKNFIIKQALNIKSKYNIDKFNNDYNSYYLKSVLNKIVNCNYLNKLNKRKLKKIFNEYF